MARAKIQWHPLFAHLLRPRVERYYEVLTNLAVGDVPRQADLALLRRRGTGPAPFTGLWRVLTAWNVLEFKGPTVRARPRDVLLLIELGLGIARRLNAERRRPLKEAEISFWYLANQLGSRFLHQAADCLGELKGGSGIWQGQALGFPCVFVSAVDLPVDEDSLPLHVLAQEPVEKQRQIGQFIAGEADWLEIYRGVFATLHPQIWRELQTMGRSRQRKLSFDIRPVAEYMGLKELIRQIGEKAVIEQIGEKAVIEQIGEKAVIEQIGEKAVIEQIGEKAVIEQIGKKKIAEHLDLDDILSGLSPARRQQLLRRLQEEAGRG
jgi:hypothetical protein